MKRTAVRITRRHLRSFVTMDQLAAAVAKLGSVTLMWGRPSTRSWKKSKKRCTRT